MQGEDAEYQQYDVEDDEPEAYQDSLKCPDTIQFRLDVDEEICRACLNSGTIPIFGDEDSEDVSEEFKYFTCIDVSPDDSLPQNLCQRCRDLLQSAIIFKKFTQKSDNILRKRTEEDIISNIDNESKGIQVGVADDLDSEKSVESCDKEDLEDGVYLEYAETVNDSENENTDSDIEESHILFNDNSSIPESIDLDAAELETLVDSLNKNARFLQCEVCNITFRTSEQINDHSLCHDSEEIVTCEVCKHIICKDLHSIHLKLHRISFNRRIQKKYQKVECTVCGKSVSKSYLKKHIEMHTTNKRRSEKCAICEKFFSGNLSDHIRLRHSDNQHKPNEEKSILKVKCPVCSRYFKETSYESHVASHAISQKKYVCEECGREFLTPSSFSTHMLTHKEVYKYKCQFCPYRGKHLGLLKVHVRTHTKDYLYKCSTCDSRFITKSNLSAHEKTHSDRAKFVCPECGKCFAVQRTLKNHMVSVHQGIKAYSCDLCGKSYGCKDVMMAHKKKIHHVPPITRVGRLPAYLLGAQENSVEDD